MISNEKLAGMLNDLIRINNDRYEGYANLLSRKVILDGDVWKLVCDLAKQSRMNSSSLIVAAIKLRTSQQTGSNLSAGIYSPHMGIKTEISGLDRQCILDNCRHREDLVQKAYYDALSSGIDIPEDVAILIAEQKKEMKAASMLVRAKHVQPVSNAA
jgi:uncharacterized protein (TIGR02284 family)